MPWAVVLARTDSPEMLVALYLRKQSASSHVARHQIVAATGRNARGEVVLDAAELRLRHVRWRDIRPAWPF